MEEEKKIIQKTPSMRNVHQPVLQNNGGKDAMRHYETPPVSYHNPDKRISGSNMNRLYNRFGTI